MQKRFKIESRLCRVVVADGRADASPWRRRRPSPTLGWPQRGEPCDGYRLPNTISRLLELARPARFVAGEVLRLRQPGGRSQTRHRSRSRFGLRPGAAGRSVTRGDPESGLRWTARARRIWRANSSGTSIPPVRAPSDACSRPPDTVCRASQDPGRQAACRPQRPVRAHQRHRAGLQRRGQPVISVDTRRRNWSELQERRREWRPKGEPDAVLVHDFLDKSWARPFPTASTISRPTRDGQRGIDHDTARFAAEAIYRWWKKMGSKRYPRPANS